MKKRQWIGALIGSTIALASIIALLLHWFAVAVSILLCGVVVTYVLAIAWLRDPPSGRDTPSRRDTLHSRS